MLVLSTRIVLDLFELLSFYSEKFSTDVCRLPYAVNVNLNLSKGSVQTSHFTRAESNVNERKQLMFFNGNKFGTCELRRRRLNRDLIR